MKLYTLDIYQESGLGGHYTKKIFKGLQREKTIEKAREWLRAEKKRDKYWRDWNTSPDSWGTGPYGHGYSCGPYYIEITVEDIE